MAGVKEGAVLSLDEGVVEAGVRVPAAVARVVVVARAWAMAATRVLAWGAVVKPSSHTFRELRSSRLAAVDTVDTWGEAVEAAMAVGPETATSHAIRSQLTVSCAWRFDSHHVPMTRRSSGIPCQGYPNAHPKARGSCRRCVGTL